MRFVANCLKSSDIQIHKTGVRARAARIIRSRGIVKCFKMSNLWAAVEVTIERRMAKMWMNMVMNPAELDKYT